MNTIEINYYKYAEQEPPRYEFTFQGMELYTQVCTTYGVEEIYHTDPETNNTVVIGYLTRSFVPKEPWSLTFYHEILGHYITHTQIYQYRLYDDVWILFEFGVENEFQLSPEETFALQKLQEQLEENRPGLNHWLNLKETELIPTIQPWIETAILK